MDNLTTWVDVWGAKRAASQREGLEVAIAMVARRRHDLSLEFALLRSNMTRPSKTREPPDGALMFGASGRFVFFKTLILLFIWS